MQPDDDAFRAGLEALLARSGWSKRRLSLAMGRDVGYVAALMDPTRPSRARPTPTDLLRLSDATGIAFVELIEVLWGIDRSRVADELAAGKARSTQPDVQTRSPRARPPRRRGPRPRIPPRLP